MRFYLGENLDAPRLSATVTADEWASCLGRPGFRRSMAQLKRQRNVLVTEDEQGQTMEFLLEKIGRRPRPTHEDHLRPVAEMFDWLSLLTIHPKAQLAGLRIDTEPANGVFPMNVSLNWPTNRDDKKISAFVTNTVREVGHQLKYRYNEGAIVRYDTDVYAELHRQPQVSSGVNTISVADNPTGITGLGPAGRDQVGTYTSFALRAENVTTYKQLVMCMAGAIAISQADELVV